MTQSAPPPLSDAARLLLAVLPRPRLTSILDIGANPVHPPPYAALLAAGGCRITGFEPQERAFAALQATRGPLEDYHPHAIGNGQPQQLKVYRISGLTSLFDPHLPGLAAIGCLGWRHIISRHDLPTVALDDIPDLAPCDLLKIDVQGAEAMILDHATRTLAPTVAVIVELRHLQLYEGEPMLGGVDTALRRQGFQLHRFLFNKSTMLPNSQAARLVRRRHADQLIDGDAVYLRHPGTLPDWTDAQVMHLALLACTCFASHSLVLRCLDDLVRRGTVTADLPAAYVDALPAELRAPAPAPAAEAEADPPRPPR